MQLRLLRCFLGLAAIVWGVSVYGVFASWPAAAAALESLGAGELPPQPMLDYWLRMAAGVFTLIGCWALLLMLWPGRFRAAIPWFGGFMLAEGIILLVHGLRLHLAPLPFLADAAACLILGGGILVLSWNARPGH